MWFSNPFNVTSPTMTKLYICFPQQLLNYKEIHIILVWRLNFNLSRQIHSREEAIMGLIKIELLILVNVHLCLIFMIRSERNIE